jgi:hypothetical protein
MKLADSIYGGILTYDLEINDKPKTLIQESYFFTGYLFLESLFIRNERLLPYL